MNSTKMRLNAIGFMGPSIICSGMLNGGFAGDNSPEKYLFLQLDGSLADHLGLPKVEDLSEYHGALPNKEDLKASYAAAWIDPTGLSQFMEVTQDNLGNGTMIAQTGTIALIMTADQAIERNLVSFDDVPDQSAMLLLCQGISATEVTQMVNMVILDDFPKSKAAAFLVDLIDEPATSTRYNGAAAPHDSRAAAAPAS